MKLTPAGYPRKDFYTYAPLPRLFNFFKDLTETD